MKQDAHKEAPKEKVTWALEEIRRMIVESGLSQRKVEQRAGISSGYLSQLLAGKSELKIWHILAILDALKRTPGDFFRAVYGSSRCSLAEIAEAAKKAEPDKLSEVDDSFREPVGDLIARLERVEMAIGQISHKIGESTSRTARHHAPRKEE